MKKVIFIVGILAVVLGTAAFWIFSPGGNPSVSLEFSRPGEILLGQKFQLSVSFSNFSDDILKNVRLALSLPDGVSFVGQPANQRVTEQLVGDLGPGSLGQESFDLIVTSGEQSLKKIQAKLIYSVAPNDRITFENEAETDVRVGRPAVDLLVETPEGLFSGENFELKVKYKNNTQSNFENFALKLNYPPNFKYQKSSVEPSVGNNIWKIGTLEPNSEAEFTVLGSIVGQEGAVGNFEAGLSTEILGQSYEVNAKQVNVKVTVAPLSLYFTANNSESYAAKLSDNLRYKITYKNNSDFAMQNVRVRVKLTGEMFDFSSARANAAWNSLTNTFTWTAADEPKLANLAPGAEGSLDLEIKVRDSFSIKRLGDKDFVLKLEGEIDSPTVPPGVNAARTVSVGNFQTKMAGKVEVEALAFFWDAASGILNSGPFPPKVNQPTEYTIHWKVKNYATDVSGVAVSAYLQSGGKLTGEVRSSIGNPPVFDENSGKVTWVIGSLPATRGVLGEGVEAIFQVEVTPNSNQVGKDIDILSETEIRATDDFTGTTLIDVDTELTTELPDDPAVTGETRVQP